MKSIGVADKYGWNRYVAPPGILFNFANREYEWELMPLGIDQKVGAIVYGRHWQQADWEANTAVTSLFRKTAVWHTGCSPVLKLRYRKIFFYNTIDALMR